MRFVAILGLALGLSGCAQGCFQQNVVECARSCAGLGMDHYDSQTAACACRRDFMDGGR